MEATDARCTTATPDVARRTCWQRFEQDDCGRTARAMVDSPVKGITALHVPLGVTLEQLAAEKHWPEAIPKLHGWCNSRWNGNPAIAIPYIDDSGQERAKRFRTRLTGPDHYRWRKGDKPMLYGLNSRADIEEAGWTLLVEGVIAQANEILAQYAAQGYDLSLRQLYCQFVARELLANNQRNYKRLGASSATRAWPAWSIGT